MNASMKLTVMMHVFLSYIFLFFIPPSVTALSYGDDTDRLALLSFKEHIKSDPYQIMSSWNDSIHFCNWTGITCDPQNLRIITLFLISSGFSGSVSPAIGNLSFLQILDLSSNSFTGNFPQEVGRLSRLQFLGISWNYFSGEIPVNISQCPDLIELDLGHNSFVGVIPNEFKSLTKLQIIYLYDNYLTGEIPKFIGNFTSLLSIDGSQNSFQGSIPNTIGQLSNLTEFTYGANNLSGILPPSFFNLSSLVDINLYGNQIGGILPADMGQRFPELIGLNLPMNQFSGTIPVSLSNVSDLQKLVLDENAFTGSVPNFNGLQRLTWFAVNFNQLGNGKADDLNFVTSLANCTNLTGLGFGGNNLGGVLPKSLFNFTQLTSLSIYTNLISGEIPSEIGQLVKVRSLLLYSNQFTGTIPESIGNLRNLGALSLGRNSLSGYIPLSLGNLTLLSRLQLQDNNLEGTVPSSLSNCRVLHELDLSKNNLSGYIPKEICSMSSLTVLLDLSYNHFVGFLPSEVGGLKNLIEFNVTNNMISGVIPDSLGTCTSLAVLSMAGNSIQGEIPARLSSLRGLEVLDLSNNNLTGVIPEYLGDFFFLKSLNLSFNGFVGKLPDKGVFKNVSEVSIYGNAKLCGEVPEFQLPKCSLEEPSRRNQVSPSIRIIIPILSVIILLIMVVTAYLVHKKRHDKKDSAEGKSNFENFPRVSYRSLQKATNGFSHENLIGSGKFSSVYKAILSTQEKGPLVVAVKVLKLAVHGANKSFIAECDALKKIRHRNLVKIVTSCSGIDFQGNDFKALIYSYIANGSLEDWLHHHNPVVGNFEIEEATRCLNLLQRLNIMIDVAKALNYIHCECGSPMVHCDLKPSNVLLDVDLVAYLGDFGLARFIQQTTHDSSSNSLGIKGTIGYAAPEYAMGSNISTYGDIYSFGILILEMLTGKHPTHDMFCNGLSLHEYVKMAIPDHIMEITDPVLIQTMQLETTNHSQMHRSIKEFLKSVYQIGITCSMESPRDRIDIINVFDQLQVVKKTFLMSGVTQHKERTSHQIHSIITMISL